VHGLIALDPGGLERRREEHQVMKGSRT
jgi:hypothetical protein